MAKTDDAKEGVVQERNLTDSFHAYMRTRAVDNASDADGEEIMSEQAARILSAESVEDILKADMGGTVQCRDVAGTFWEIRGFKVAKSNRSDIENSHGYYVQYDAVCIGGDETVMQKNGLEIGGVYPLQTSALLLITKTRALEAADAFPIRLALIGFKTASGNQVLRWGSLPKTTMTGTPAS